MNKNYLMRAKMHECQNITERTKEAFFDLKARGFSEREITLDDLARWTGCHNVARLSQALDELQDAKIIDLDPKYTSQ